MSHVVTLRLNDEEYCKLKQAVKRTKLPQSEFIRNALVNRVHAVMQVKSIKQKSEVVKEMVSKNNAKMVQQKMADQKQKFGIRKLSVGVASVLLGTVFYMQSGTVYADVNPVASDGSDNVNVANEKPISSSSEEVPSTSNSADSDNSTRPVVPASDAGNSTIASQVSASPVKSTASQVSDLASAVSGQESSSSASQVNVGTDNIADRDNTNVVSSSP